MTSREFTFGAKPKKKGTPFNIGKRAMWKHNALLVPSDFSMDKSKLRETHSDFSMDPKKGQITTKNLREEIADQFTDFHVDKNGEVPYGSKK